MWAGVCLILPLLTGFQAAEEANSDGFTEVTARMRYYVALEPLLHRLGETPGTPDNLMEEVKGHLVGLYQRILEFQIKSVLRFFRSRPKNFVRDTLPVLDNWQEMRDTIKTMETTVRADFEQINALESRQELQCLNSKVQQSLSTMTQLFSVAEKHLEVSKKQTGSRRATESYCVATTRSSRNSGDEHAPKAGARMPPGISSHGRQCGYLVRVV